ncbi:MAG: arginine N-succinyltransferase [Desulfobulbaceae bacterium]|nr:arginine N-succinyltransferase [Desulfobulbaceae bacterium]
MEQTKEKKGFSGLQVLGIVMGVMVATILVTLFAARAWLFPQPFTPVVLSPKEEQQLEEKLERFESLTSQPVSSRNSSPDRSQRAGNQRTPSANEPVSSPVKVEKQTASGSLEPQAYSEEGASREINLSEREINGLLAKNTDLARKVAIDLADNLISTKILLPVDPDFPIFGGKTLRVRAGAELAYRDNRPIVKLRGVSVMGVPIPNAWLGGLKDIDLVSEFGADEGFWKTFADGVESISVHEGELYIKLKE